METQNGHKKGEFDEMDPNELADFELEETTEEVEDEAIRQRAEKYAEKRREKDAAMEQGFALADKVIIAEAKMEALRQSAKEQGKEAVYKEFEEATDKLPSLEGKIETLQREIQEAERQTEEFEKIYTQWETAGSWWKRLMNRMMKNADLQKKVDGAKEQLAAKEVALDEATKAYRELKEHIEALEKVLEK